MEDNFDSNIFINRDYIEKEFNFKGCTQKYKASISASTDYDLTGQIVWRAAEQLSEFIVENNQIFKDKVVLELGAGVGLSGLVCAQYAKKVFITDGNDIVCELMDINVPYAEKKNVIAEKFLWGESVRKLMDNHPDEKIDIIIGADVMFWLQYIEPLSITFKDFFNLNPDLLIFSATRIRAGYSENLFDTHLTSRNLARKVLYKEGENYFYQILNNYNEGAKEEDSNKYIIPHQPNEVKE